MSFDMTSHSPNDGTTREEVNSLKITEDGQCNDMPPSFANGTGLPLSQARLAQALTKENIGWILILALAGEVFGITDRALVLLGGVC